VAGPLTSKHPLSGRVALITGAGRGVGREIALAYAEAGAELILLARTAQEVEAVAGEARALGVRAMPVTGDVSAESDVARALDNGLAELGRIDILVNNAGVTPGAAGGPIRSLLDVSPAFWDLTFSINCRGPFLVTRAVLPEMIRRRSGVIIGITSRLSQVVVAGNVPYGPSKAALELMIRTVDREFQFQGIRANLLHPGGPVSTGVFTDFYQPHSVDELAPPSVIREAAVWLASDEAADVHGAVIDARTWNAEHGRNG
jgi:NAD(P)-dependent dehydrogenase (short-subunit alcohol dehydrogenase family)